MVVKTTSAIYGKNHKFNFNMTILILDKRIHDNLVLDKRTHDNLVLDKRIRQSCFGQANPSILFWTSESVNLVLDKRIHI
jgi:hypothetical protein